MVFSKIADLSSVSPRPSWPASFLPQAHTWPSSSIAKQFAEWQFLATWRGMVRMARVTRVVRMARVRMAKKRMRMRMYRRFR